MSPPPEPDLGMMPMSIAVTTDEQLVTERLDALLRDFPPGTTRPQAFLEAQFDAGLAWVHFPVGDGGLGVSPKLQEVVTTRLREQRAPSNASRSFIGLGMCAPTVVTHGTDAQRARYLRPLFSGAETWCQLFSEPGAGSDVAGLATRAGRDGDEWTVNGQKVWTTVAHVSDFGILIARTDTEVPKHKGLTMFICDMHAPGVEIRPLRQMTGEAEFNEVYFTDVRIPDDQRLGDIGDGWRVSLTTLMNERVSIGGSITEKGAGAIGQALELWSAYRQSPRAGGPADAVLRDRLAKLWSDAEVLRLTNLRASANRKMGTPGPEGSVAKVAMAELNKRVYELCIDLLGPDGLLYGSYEMVRPDGVNLNPSDVRKAFLRARANSIEGGTTEIMRNILGERVLGLPGDVRVDRELPWSQVPRS
jgi:alkylation response protein AidB-like acyl-CoA dehydrogenase